MRQSGHTHKQKCVKKHLPGPPARLSRGTGSESAAPPPPCTLPRTPRRTHARNTPPRHTPHPTHPCRALIPPSLRSLTLPHSTPHAHSEPGTPPPHPPSQHTPRAPPYPKPTIAHASHTPHITPCKPAAASSEETAAPPPAPSPASSACNHAWGGGQGRVRTRACMVL